MKKVGRTWKTMRSSKLIPRTKLISMEVYTCKRKHHKMDDTDFNPIADNYVSALISAQELEEKFREEEMLGEWSPPNCLPSGRS